jgi:RNA polymerase sigma-70 factor, ECF subfamily
MDPVETPGAQAPRAGTGAAPVAGGGDVDVERVEAGLVAAIAAGDRDALAALYDRHVARLTALATRVVGGDTAQAEDVVHDVFVEAWHHAAEFDAARGTVRAWLTIRTRSRALDRRARLERGARAAVRQGQEVAAAGATTGPLAVAVDGGGFAGHDAEVVRRSLADLPPPLVEVIEGAYYDGLTTAALAARLAIPQGTVKSRLARALAELRHRINPDAASRPAARSDARPTVGSDA